jgi:hypothetical protein
MEETPEKRESQERELQITFALTRTEFEAAEMGEVVMAIAKENNVALDPYSWVFGFITDRCLSYGIDPKLVWHDLEQRGAVQRVIERMEAGK